MTAARAVLAVCLVLALGLSLSAADKPKDLIVGKWEPVEKQNMLPIIEFTKDGKLKMSIAAANVNIEGVYKFVDETNVEVEITFMGQTQKEKLKVEVTKDELTTTDTKAKVEKFKRVK